MRRAKFLGLRDDKGGIDYSPCQYERGQLLFVYPRWPGYVGPYPWANKLQLREEYSGGFSVFRDSELELLEEKELDLNDYL